METAFKKWGNSQGIIIPKPVLEIVGIEENETVNVAVEDGAIVIRKIQTRKPKTIQDYFMDYSGTHKNEELEWGDPVGDEVW